MPRSKAFTLIELLIVVAIIGILSAIAVPNLRDARMRAAVARVQGDFHTIGLAVDTFLIDNRNSPQWIMNVDVNQVGQTRLLKFEYFNYNNPFNNIGFLTSPIAYLHDSSEFLDSFGKGICIDQEEKINAFYRLAFDHERKKNWILGSFGPDSYSGGFSTKVASREYKDSGSFRDYPVFFSLRRYDVTNGLLSNGDLHAYQHGSPSTEILIVDGIVQR